MIGAGVLIVLGTVAVVAYARMLGDAHACGHVFVSRRRTSAVLQKLVGRNATAVMTIAVMLAAAFVAALLHRWSADYKRLEDGDYSTAQGRVAS